MTFKLNNIYLNTDRREVKNDPTIKITKIKDQAGSGKPLPRK
jgi:hypothetical protein